MRITKLKLKNYKNLENFEWELNPDYPVAVIVGKNGSGKTNLLEAIITIFQDLQLYDHESKTKSLPKFEFEIEYLNLDDTINIKNDGTLKITKNGENVPLSQLQNFRQDISQGEDVLPKSIFVYYAGNTTRLAELTDKSISAYHDWLVEIVREEVEVRSFPKQNLYYYDLLHHRCVFLTLLLMQGRNQQLAEKSEAKNSKQEINSFLSDELEIIELDSVEIKIARPIWKRTQGTKTFSNDSANLWNPPIFLRLILELIKESSNKETLINANEIIFNIEGKKLIDSFTNKTNEQDFFQQLSNLILAGYLTDVKIYFKKDGVDEILEFNDLSEGEWQRIGIRGAMELFQGEETLFLLDEPDTFAHPSWQWEFVPDIEKTVGKENKSMQAVFITHSPLVLSSLKDNIFMMEKGKNIKPIHEAYGESLEIVLTKMDGDSNNVEDDFKQYFKLIEEGKADTDEAKAERKRLEEKYGVSHSEIARAEMWISFYK
jgi:predicted ATP-dependent endonuclease of OLD family